MAVPLCESGVETETAILELLSDDEVKFIEFVLTFWGNGDVAVTTLIFVLLETIGTEEIEFEIKPFPDSDVEAWVLATADGVVVPVDTT